MKKCKHFFLLVMIIHLMILSACINSQVSEKYKKMQQFTLLEGDWQFEIDNGLFGEHWKKENDSVFSGMGYMLIGDDTVSREILSLEQQSSDIYYIATVEGHNNGQPVKFIMTSDSNNVFVFENKDHDFPQRITYQFDGSDNLLAIVEGYQEGEPSKMELYYTRMKVK